MSVSVCLSVCWRTSETTRPNTKLSIRVIRAVARSSCDNSGIRYVLPVLLMTSFCRVFHNWPHGAQHWQYLRERRSGASRYKFPTYSPEGATLFDFVVVYSGNKLRTGGVSDNDVQGAAIGWWPAAWSIKTGDEVCSLHCVHEKTAP